jgi:uncharacterized protein (DUF2141 family)
VRAGLDLRIPAALLLALAWSACASAPAKPRPVHRPPGTGHVEVTVTGMESQEGEVLVALFLGEEGWPDEQAQAFGTRVLPIDGGPGVADFEDVPAGPFAVSVFHDKNGNRQLDTGLFGIPTEDYGFSRDARGTFGPPSFDDARIELKAGETKRIAIEVK